jgi:protein SCO1
MRSSRGDVCAVFALILLLGVMSSSCRQGNQPAIRRYKLKGVVVSVDRQSHYATINHEDIPGFMDAMTMAYEIRNDKAFAQLAAGDQITADVVVSRPQYWLENIVIVKKGAPSGASSLSPFHQPQPGEAVPDFTLLNQDGRRIRFRHFRGKGVLMTFIYTRCPLPDYCPRMTANFAEINRTLMRDSKIYAKARLLSVSFDPKHDTPRVLRDYGLPYIHEDGMARFDHWEFASVPETELKDVARALGLQYWVENGQITHSMSTTLITPAGRIYKWYSGNDWKPADVANDMKRMLQTPG